MRIDFAQPMNAEQRENFLRSVSADARLSGPFLVLSVASCAIATIGLIANSPAVIIGAMIVAPLLSPIAAIGYAVVTGNGGLLRRSCVTLAVGVATAIVISSLLSLLTGVPSYGSEILARSQPTILDLGVALAAGFVAAYARIRSEVSTAIAGTAIAVALMPPVCTIGIGLAHADLRLASGAGLLFATNLLGIAFAVTIVYIAAGFFRADRARRGIVWLVTLVIIVAVPLGASFARLLDQARIEHTLRNALVTGTATFRRAQLAAIDFDWISAPPTVELTVRSAEPITSTQVRLLEEYARRKTGVRFQLVFDVLPVERVTDEATPEPSPSP